MWKRKQDAVSARRNSRAPSPSPLPVCKPQVIQPAVPANTAAMYSPFLVYGVLNSSYLFHISDSFPNIV